MFIENCVRIVSDPLVGEIQDPVSGVAEIKNVSGFKLQPRNCKVCGSA